MATPIPTSFKRKMRRAYPCLFRRLNRVLDTPSLSSSETLPAEPLAANQDKTGLLPVAARQCTTPGTNKSCSHCEADAEQVGGGYVTVRGNGRLETAWAHVEHWMWPLFTDRWGPFRERLGLHPCPLAEDEPTAAAAATCERDLPAEIRHTLYRTGVDSSRLPLVLYLFSSLVVDTSPFWPKGVRACGYLYPAPATTAQVRRNHEEAGSDRVGQGVASPGASMTVTSDCRHPNPIANPETTRDCSGREPLVTAEATLSGLPPALEAFLSPREDRPVCVGFGSMWGMCPPGYRLDFALRVMLLGVHQARARCVVILPAREEIGAWENGVSEGVGEKEGRLKELVSATDYVLGEFAASVGQDRLLVSGAGVGSYGDNPTSQYARPAAKRCSWRRRAVGGMCWQGLRAARRFPLTHAAVLSFCVALVGDVTARYIEALLRTTCFYRDARWRFTTEEAARPLPF